MKSHAYQFVSAIGALLFTFALTAAASAPAAAMIA